MIGNYFRKMAGTTQSPPRVSLSEILWSWLGAFLGIAAVAYINYGLLDKTDLVMIIGSFGASAVLIYGAIKSPLAQPRNLLGGHVISALIGVTAFKLAGTQSLAGRGPGSGHQHRGDARHQDAPPAGRRHRPHRGDQRRQSAQPGLSLRPGARGRRRPRHAGRGPAGEQPGPPPALPRILVVRNC